jgi:hypothetical protein
VLRMRGLCSARPRGVRGPLLSSFAPVRASKIACMDNGDMSSPQTYWPPDKVGLPPQFSFRSFRAGVQRRGHAVRSPPDNRELHTICFDQTESVCFENFVVPWLGSGEYPAREVISHGDSCFTCLIPHTNPRAVKATQILYLVTRCPSAILPLSCIEFMFESDGTDSAS